MGTCVLHNLIRLRNPAAIEGDVIEIGQNNLLEDSLTRIDPLPSIQLPASRSSQLARAQRNYLKNYCNSRAGAVAWQLERI